MYGDYFARENFGGGGGFRHPWECPSSNCLTPCLINSSGLQKCGILDGHALRVLLHQHSQLRGLQTSCAIARDGWLKDIKRRGAPAQHCQYPLKFARGKFRQLP